MTIDRNDVLVKLVEACRGAAELVMKVYAEADVGTEMKGPNDPVTRADKEANAFILGQLKAHFPHVPIVAEESDAASYKGYGDSEVALFVDPVDGTRDFIAKNGEFCVMIGLAEEGRATVGVVLCPVFYGGKERVYGGAEGIGAFLFDDAGGRTPVRVASGTDLAAASCAVSRFHRSKSVDAKLTALGCRALVPIGSSGIKGVQIANGELGIYAHPSRGVVKLWDACAPDAIVRAAGGIYTDAKGYPFAYRGAVAQGAGTLAANPELHAEALRRFADYDKSTGGETLA